MAVGGDASNTLTKGRRASVPGARSGNDGAHAPRLVSIALTLGDHREQSA